MTRPHLPLRDLDAGYFLDLFLVSAVTSVLAIRFFLKVTHYPHLSAGPFHIAHILWGGLLMLVAIVILLSYLGRGGAETASILGGIGFGAFIDELGKFITRDNDYFYKPTVALIYLVFVLTWLLIRSIHRERTAAPAEYLANALNMLRKLATGPLTVEEREKTLGYLRRSDAANPTVPVLLQLVEGLTPAPPHGPGRLTRIRIALLDAYRHLSTRRMFTGMMILFFLLQLLVNLVNAGMVLGLERLTPAALSRIPLFQPDRFDDRTRAEWGQLWSSLLAGSFVLLGIARIGRDRLGALRMFQRSVLVSIFLTQPFMFYQREWQALGALTFNLMVYLALRFMIERERSARIAGQPAHPGEQ